MATIALHWRPCALTRRLPAIAGLVLGAFEQASAQAPRIPDPTPKPYEFINVAEQPMGDIFLLPPAINDSGTVLFSSDTGVHTVSSVGGPITTRVDTSGRFSTGFKAGYPDINNAGVVAFYGNLDYSGEGPNRGLFTAGPDGTVTTVATAAPPQPGRGAPAVGEFDRNFLATSFDPAINDAGAVVFRARRDAATSGVFVHHGSDLSLIADTGGEFAAFPWNPSINNAGDVTFTATRRHANEGVFLSSGGSIRTVIDNIDGEPGSFVDARVNDVGTVAVQASRQFAYKLLTIAADGRVTTIADTETYQSLGFHEINNAGLVAFSASLDELDGNGFYRVGIFTGPNPVADKVITSGDSLFGSTVSYAGIQFLHGLNDRGEIAFKYRLDDGRWGFAVARPAGMVPEPAILMLLACGGLPLLRPSRRLDRQRV